MPAGTYDLKTVFDFDLFGVGIDAGQTTIRLRHAYGQWGPVGAGQLESPFMDLDVFPNILDYWGPNGMIFFRNVHGVLRADQQGEGLQGRRSRSSARARAATPAASPTASSCRTSSPRFPWPDFSAGVWYQDPSGAT